MTAAIGAELELAEVAGLEDILDRRALSEVCR